jgi:pyruvate formate-lyase/glycerol dehydratase family glycyl radical enzyme
MIRATEKAERSRVSVEQRIERMRNRYLEVFPEICPQRAELVTQAYREAEGFSFLTKKALALKKVLSEMDIYIEEDQRIAGNQAGKQRAAPIFPEYSVEWIERELDSFPGRTGDVFEISEDSKRRLRPVFSYWKGKTHEDQVLRTLPDEVKQAWEIGVISPGGITHTGDGHLIVDWDQIVDRGIPGFKKVLQTKLAELDFSDGRALAKHEFYKAALISMEAVLTYIERYAGKARQEVERCTVASRREELSQLDSICRELLQGKPSSFYAALQLVAFVHIVLHIESNGHSFSLGRFDQYLLPFFRDDIDSGRLAYDQALELVSCFFLKLNTINKVRPWGHTEFGVGYATYQNMIIGGMLPDGSDGTNELSYLCLEADKLVRLFQPNLAARIHPGTPRKFLAECGRCIRLGYGKPALFNDQVVVPALMNLGIPLQEARQYAMVGCVTPVVPGKWNHRCTGMTFMNVGKMLELTLNGGKDPGTGICPLALHQDLRSFDSIEQLWEAFREQFAYYIRVSIIADNVCDFSLQDHDADPFCSSFINDCIARGKTAKNGGAVYDYISGLITGASTVGDSMSAIEDIVFDRKLISGEELLEALGENFGGGGERIRELCRRAPKFGNDISGADSNVSRVYRMYMDLSGEYRTLRMNTESKGCRWTPSTATISANTPLGAKIGATPDGRGAGMPVNEGASPCHGADQNGPTATMLSVAKLPNVQMAGGQLLNMKFTPAVLEGDSGIEKFIDLIRTYFLMGGFHVQFNVVDAETLKDAKVHPERHRDLIVRVAAYCALFTSLAPDVQDEIIARTEHTRI